ncbi:cholesterol oxidase [Nocardioides baekrokdamisoli]|uniref:Cholesterol oxidase n=1 Tax=Nocardioides baekrokdamisoli TaxID=1804624 RepID=A0A3G9IFE2_9ACTN|nr:GMC oxidoreductase [Nocardioides baekrokdamisoli]BBH17760.1 cholesterol oxidase [Nocardioides baekrokdamisoli]
MKKRSSIRKTPATDYDWVVVGSGFGGSVAALRLAEKGYRVAVMERGKAYADEDLPRSTSDRRRFFWAPALGLRGIMRSVLFRHVFSSTQTGVGGGSLVYGGVLFRPQAPFYDDPQWRDLADWEGVLSSHYQTAERMLGADRTPWESVSMSLSRQLADHFDGPETFMPAPVAVFFGEPGKTVPDPYFGGEGPDRTGCTRCGQCMTGCRIGAANRLTKNYLWFAEKLGVAILAETEVVDVTAIGAADGADGYRIATRSQGPGLRRRRRTMTAAGVVFAGGAVATNELLADCKHRGTLPHISDRLGTLVRTNSEAVVSVLLPQDCETWRDVTASSRVLVDGDTQIEFLTYGPNGDFMRFMFTTLVGAGPAPARLLKWIRSVVAHPRQWAATLRSGWSRRTVMMLVMQPRDNAIRFRAKKRLIGRGYKLATAVDADRPAPTHLEVGHTAATWLAEQTGGIPQSSVFEAFGNMPMTAHVLGGAAVGASPIEGVIDDKLRVFGYRDMLVCDGAALPANPGVNPALTIAAMAEHAMAHVAANGLGR